MKLEAQEIVFAYRQRQVLAGASLHLQAGEVVCLLGANGAGKSSLLKTMMGLQRPQSGQVLLDGKPLPRWSRQALAQRIAYVPQAHVAPFPYSVQQVVLMGRMAVTGLWRAAGQADHAYAAQVMQQVGVAHLAQRPYTELSGGERQLVLIARALAQQAQLLVLDEPMAGLDYGNQLRLLDRLDALAQQGLGVLMSTHDPNQSLTACDRVALLIDGRIAEQGPPQQVLTPQAIERLYGVHVALLAAPEGEALAFQRLASGNARQPASSNTKNVPQ